jgi:hypothetical protein
MVNDHEHPTSLARRLRYITIFAYIPALGFCLGHGIAFNIVVPALGLLPATGSVLLAIYDLELLHKLFRRHDYQIIIGEEHAGMKPGARRRFMVAATDAFLALTLVAIIITALIVAGEYWGRSEAAIVASYATFPLWVDA